HLRAGENVVVVRGEAEARNLAAALGERGVGPELVAVAVQIVDAGGDDHALEVLPGTLADAVAGVDGLGRVRHVGVGAEISVPGLAAGTGAGGELLALRIGAFEATQVAALVEAL